MRIILTLVHCINRTILECKDCRTGNERRFLCCINRTILECKDKIHVEQD